MNASTRMTFFIVGTLAVLVAGAIVASSLRQAESTSAAAPSTAPSPSPAATPRPDFAVVVEDNVRPSVEEIEGLEDGDPARPVGRLDSADGTTDIVLDELIVSTRSTAELDAFLARWNGELLDSFPEAKDGLTDHLVRIDPTTADPSAVAADLAAFEDHEGSLRLSDDRALRLLAIMAAETARHGTTVSLNPLESPAEVADGEAQEASDQGNPFTWSYLKGGGIQDFAVAPAWQLLEAHGRLKKSVRVMVHDGGFSSNPDFPDDTTLRHAKWGDKNRMGCGDNDCPYHGTDVVLTFAGQLDNSYGTVGPAGPVVDEMIVVAVHSDQWKRLRVLDNRVDEYRPHVVNMSYGSTITAGRAAAQDIFDRRYKSMRDHGALLVASAGNNGYDIDQEKCVAGSCFERRLVLPCESTHVLCVGGLAYNSTTRDPSSNFGWKDDRRSVEIWGPYQTVSIKDANRAYLDYTTRWVHGTSFSSPFVAGIAALVKAADPSLGPDEIRDILNETANSGVAEQWITGSQRRVDALAAVARALDVDLDGPAVSIDFPKHGKDYSVSNWLQLKGSAVDFRDVALPIRWVSSLDGELGNAIGTVSLGELSLGTHVLTATATDALGQEGTAQVTFDVIRRPIEITLTSPANGTVVEEGDPIALAAGTTDPDDYYQQLDDSDVRWTIRRSGGGTVVWTKKGHDRILDGSVLAPGAYTVTFEATAHGSTVSESRTITVAALPPGHTKPEVRIWKPTGGTVLHTGGGKVQLQLSGSANDAEDGPLSGTRFRWVATAGDTTVVLCTGSDFLAPSGGTGGIGTIKGNGSTSCANTTVELGVSPGAPGDPTWQIRLEVRDLAGDHGTDIVAVDVVVHVG